MQPRNQLTRIAAVAAVVALGLGACSGPGSNSGTTSTTQSAAVSCDGGTVKTGATINYILPAGWSDMGALRDNVAEYEKATGNKVTLQVVPDKDYDGIVQSRLAAKSGVDIFAGQDKLDNPSTVMVPAQSDCFSKRISAESLKGITAKDGKVYGYPTAMPLSSYGVFYNTEVFKAAGVELPKTLDDLTKGFEQIKAKGTTPLFVAGKDGWTLLQFRNAANATLPAETPDIFAQLNANKTSWTSSSYFVKEHEALSNWARGGLINNDPIAASYEESAKAVAAGKAGALINGSWVMGEFVKAGAGEKIGFFPLPTPDGKVMIGVSSPTTLKIASFSKVSAESADFLLFMMAKAQLDREYAKAPGVSPFTDVSGGTLLPALKSIADISAKPGQSTVAFDGLSPVKAPEQELISAYQELVAGRTTAADFGKVVDESWKKAGALQNIPGF